MKYQLFQGSFDWKQKYKEYSSFRELMDENKG